MASRSIAIRIVLDNKDALNAAKAQILLTREMNREQEKSTHLQNGMTNSFIKGNLAARAISMGFEFLKGALVSGAKAAIEFEYTMAKIAAVSGGSELTLKSLEGTIRSLALSTNQSQEGVAKTALEMGKLGLTAAQVEESLGGVIKLSKALDEDMVQTGETVVSVMHAYNMTASDTDAITNQLAFTVKESALDMEKFGVAFSYVGGVAASAGVSFEELQGAMDILSNAGIRSSTIGTGLRRIIAELSDENSKASKVAGGTIQSYGGLVNALIALKDKNLDADAATDLFGRTASSVASIGIKYARVIEQMGKKTGEAKGIIDPMSDLMGGTFKSSIDGITTSWKDLNIEISKSSGFLKSIAGLTGKAIDALKERFKVGNLQEEFKNKDPEGYKSAVQSAWKQSNFRDRLFSLPSYNDLKGLPSDVSLFSTPEYLNFMRKEDDKKTREDSAARLQEALGKQKLPKGWDVDKWKSFNIKPEDTAAYNYIQSVWGTDTKGFEAVWQKAVENWALKAEMANKENPLDVDRLDFGDNKKGKKQKKDPYVELDPFEMMSNKLNEQQENGNTYQENFSKNLAKEKDKLFKEKQKLKPVQAMAISKDEIDDYAEAYKHTAEGIREIAEATKESQVRFVEMQASVEAVNGSFAILSEYFVEGIFSSKEDPFKGISDSFGNFAKKLIADVIAMTAKILFFRGVLALLGVGSGGTLTPVQSFATQLATSTTGAKFASGTDQVVNKPTLFMAGESGKERITVTPRAKMSSNRSGGSIVVNIQGDVMDGAKFTEAVAMAQKRLNRRLV